MKAIIDTHYPELVTIPGGDFAMGDIWGDGDADELPLVPRYCETFRLGKYAVTNSQFLWFLTDANAQDLHHDSLVDIRNRNNPIYFDGSRFTCRAGFENYPATYVNWLGASAYSDWLSKKMGFKMRLPSELEWQYTAMGGRQLKWGLGDTFNPADYVCGNEGAASADFGAPSDWGLFNMTGNVFEWCNDEYRFSLIENANNVLRNNRVIKGGAFILRDSTNLRNAKRFSCHQESCISSIGFRVAAELDQLDRTNGPKDEQTNGRYPA